MIPTQLILDIARKSNERARNLAAQYDAQLRERRGEFYTEFRKTYEELDRAIKERDAQMNAPQGEN
jgi:hypothetical protein